MLCALYTPTINSAKAASNTEIIILSLTGKMILGANGINEPIMGDALR
jgi:hypothetical protein